MSAVSFSDLVIPITLEEGAVKPEFKTAAAAGMDLCAIEDVLLNRGFRPRSKPA